MAHAWQRLLAIVEDDGGHVGREERFRIRRCGVPADDHRHVRREPAHVAHQIHDLIALEGMHGGNAHEAGAAGAHHVIERPAETQVRQRDAVSVPLESSGDVLHAERLDAEERAESETLVAWNRTKKQNVHEERAISLCLQAVASSQRPVGQGERECNTRVYFVEPS